MADPTGSPEAKKGVRHRPRHTRAKGPPRKAYKRMEAVDADVERRERLLVHFQKMHLSSGIAHLLEREWFKGDIDPPADFYMARLLFWTYFFGQTGNAMSKKYAWQKTGLADIKTARKYVNRAIEMGLMEVRESPYDKRIDALYPTERLVQIVDRELLWFFDETRNLMHGVLEGPLPDTGAPLLFRADSPELLGLHFTRSVGTYLTSADQTPKQREKRIKERLKLPPLPGAWPTGPAKK